jgi:RNase P/RNase MRP subunit p30
MVCDSKGTEGGRGKDAWQVLQDALGHFLKVSRRNWKRTIVTTSEANSGHEIKQGLDCSRSER